MISPGPAPREGILRPCPPQRRSVPPQVRNVTQESNRLGAIGVQFEASDSQNIGCHPRIREQELFFAGFAIKTLFFVVPPQKLRKLVHFLR